MKTVTIRLTMMTDHVKNFVSLVNRYPYDMDLRSGRYVVDAKSILGIFSIDLSKPIRMTIYSDECDDLLRELDDYIVKEEPEQEQQ
ncbi:MAG TPA: HPr family phosphocarrier protein [Candidatus Ventricola intestinavium]|nr:HPr family phosphocarrier protein [Candidatus Ventricola intestinavium]